MNIREWLRRQTTFIEPPTFPSQIPESWSLDKLALLNSIGNSREPSNLHPLSKTKGKRSRSLSLLPREELSTDFSKTDYFSVDKDV